MQSLFKLSQNSPSLIDVRDGGSEMDREQSTPVWLLKHKHSPAHMRNKTHDKNVNLLQRAVLSHLFIYGKLSMKSNSTWFISSVDIHFKYKIMTGKGKNMRIKRMMLIFFSYSFD